MRRHIIISAMVALLCAATAYGAAVMTDKKRTYQGTASERAAMSTTTVTPGSSFTETDTGYEWLYNGSTWTLQFGVAASDTMQLTAVGLTPAWCSVGYDKVKFIMKTTGADSTIFLIYGKKNPGGVTVIGDSIRTGGDAEINRDYGYPGLFDSLYVEVARIDGSLAAARIQIVGAKTKK